MIARIWRGRTRPDRAAAYQEHIAQKVFPALRTMEGHRGAYLLRCEAGGKTEFLALTLWQSRAAIHQFAGDQLDRANVEPEAQAILTDYDDFARHYEVAVIAGCDDPQHL